MLTQEIVILPVSSGGVCMLSKQAYLHHFCVKVVSLCVYVFAKGGIRTVNLRWPLSRHGYLQLSPHTCGGLVFFTPLLGYLIPTQGVPSLPPHAPLLHTATGHFAPRAGHACIVPQATLRRRHPTGVCEEAPRFRTNPVCVY